MNLNPNDSGLSIYRRLAFAVLLMCSLIMSAGQTFAQAKAVIVNMAMLDVQEITPDNVFNYAIQSPLSGNVEATVKGRLTYRALGLSFSYTYRYTLRPGMNIIDGSMVHADWSYSSTAFKELFRDYKKLPAGTYEYCVEVSPIGPGGELLPDAGGLDCIYQKTNEVFLINLVDPENNAKLHEDFPVLSWTVNYPFISALTYKARVAEIKEGQNNTAAINRNNPWYQENNLTGLSVAYPVYAKPLEKFQPYAWTVDAYYKGILLGGAEPWRFTIVDDSLWRTNIRYVSYVDIALEQSNNNVYAVGQLKLKYLLKDLRTDSLQLRFYAANEKSDLIKIIGLGAKLGDNRYEIDLALEGKFKHKRRYFLELITTGRKIYKVSFVYINPDFNN